MPHLSPPALRIGCPVCGVAPQCGCLTAHGRLRVAADGGLLFHVGRLLRAARILDDADRRRHHRATIFATIAEVERLKACG